jgi:hypothetical protein
MHSSTRRVTMESATYALPREAFHDQVSLDSDHLNMMQYNYQFDEPYIIVLEKLKQCLATSPGSVVQTCNQQIAQRNMWVSYCSTDHEYSWD